MKRLAVLFALLASSAGYAMGIRADVTTRVAEAWTFAVEGAMGVVCRETPAGVTCDITRNDGKIMPVACEQPSVFSVGITCGQRPGTLAKGGAR